MLYAGIVAISSMTLESMAGSISPVITSRTAFHSAPWDALLPAAGAVDLSQWK